MAELEFRSRGRGWVSHIIGKKTPPGCPERRVMVEAAGQLIHLFRDGPDYAFILRTGCGAYYPRQNARGS